MAIKSINICSYNCNSAKKSVDIIRELIDTHDIVCLQETFLSASDSDFINGLHKDINFCISDCVFKGDLEKGRPKGGLVILWKSYLDALIKPVIFNESCLGIKIKGRETDHVINSYFP